MTLFGRYSNALPLTWMLMAGLMLVIQVCLTLMFTITPGLFLISLFILMPIIRCIGEKFNGYLWKLRTDAYYAECARLTEDRERMKAVEARPKVQFHITRIDFVQGESKP